MANKVKASGFLDAVGCQAHGLEDLTASELSSTLERVVAIGVDVYISEYDVSIADDNEQKRVMEQQFPVFYEHPAVKGITLWGYIYGATWSQAPDSGLIRNGTFRPAMTWLMDYLDR